jgi:hypothetical protein
MFSSQTVLRTTRPIIVSRTSKNQTVNGTAHMRGKQQINSFERVIFLSVSTRSQPMKLRTVRQLWGVEEPRAVSLPKIKANGYFAVETPIYFLNKGEQSEFKQLLVKNELQFICQIHTDYYDKPRDKTVAV